MNCVNMIIKLPLQLGSFHTTRLVSDCEGRLFFVVLFEIET